MAVADAVATPLSDARSAKGPGGPPGQSGWRRRVAAALFMAPAAILLGVLVGYPTVATAIRSLYGQDESTFVGADNYRTLFGTAELLVAIRNNAIWVIVFPFMVTFAGLVFAVLIERIRWVTAFRTIVFMPMVISIFASGIIWRLVYETDPNRGVINAAVGTVANAIHPPGLYTNPNTKPASGLAPGADGSMVSKATLAPGNAFELGLTGIPPDEVPPGATPARPPQGAAGALTGVVWRDFSPGGTVGTIDPGELGLPGMRLTLQRDDGTTAATTTDDLSGGFRFDGVEPGSYHIMLDASNFRSGFGGVNWLGPQSLTPASHLSETGQSLLSVPLIVIAEIVAMLWVWAGFAMVIIGAGLAALNREVLEAAHMDGATELQTFRYVTLPLLRPVLIVVLLTMVINVLKIFDIVLAISPDSSLAASTVIAVKMWQTGFTGSGDKGLSSALAVFLFVLVVPVMAFNVRRIRE